MTSSMITLRLKLYRLQHRIFFLVIVLLVSLFVLSFGNFWSGVISIRNGLNFNTSTEKKSQLNKTLAEGGSRHRKMKTDLSKIEIKDCSWNCSMSDRPAPIHAPSAGPHTDCTANRDLQIYTAQNNITVSHVPTFDVTVYNTCPDCSISNVRIECGEFASAILPDPCLFRRCAINDCLLKNGSPILPLEGLTFSYANTFAYTLRLKPVSDSDVSCTNMTAARASKTGDG